MDMRKRMALRRLQDKVVVRLERLGYTDNDKLSIRNHDGYHICLLDLKQYLYFGMEYEFTEFLNS